MAEAYTTNFRTSSSSHEALMQSLLRLQESLEALSRSIESVIWIISQVQIEDIRNRIIVDSESDRLVAQGNRQLQGGGGALCEAEIASGLIPPYTDEAAACRYEEEDGNNYNDGGGFITPNCRDYKFTGFFGDRRHSGDDGNGLLPILTVASMEISSFG